MNAVVDMPCWDVSAGPGVGHSFLLKLGKQIPLTPPIRNVRFLGEAVLSVWCSWRLDGEAAPVTSSDESEEEIAAKLRRVAGASIVAVEIEPPAWELRVTFSSGLVLRVFCDHVPGNPTFSENWHLRTPTKEISAGPGYKFEVNEVAASSLVAS